MSSLLKLNETILDLEIFHYSLGEEIERMKETRNPEVVSNLIKKTQLKIFDMALKMPFEIKAN